MTEQEIVRKVVEQVVARLSGGEAGNSMVNSSQSSDTIICNYSNRHTHVSREALDVLYGPGYQLTKFKDLRQPGEFASNEFITIVGPKGDTLPVRILGPVRSSTQVEISRGDSFALKIKGVPVRESGNVAGTPGAVLVGPKGAYNLKEGVIVAWRHVHFTPADAARFGVKDKEKLKIRVESPDRSVVFEEVVARVKSSYALEMHIDVDEANAAGVGQNARATIIRD